MVAMKPKVYTLPSCTRCDTLKGWLKGWGVEFEERSFDTDEHIEFIMRNMFGSPPIVEIGSRSVSSEELFVGESLVEGRLREVLGAEEAQGER